MYQDLGLFISEAEEMFLVEPDLQFSGRTTQAPRCMMTGWIAGSDDLMFAFSLLDAAFNPAGSFTNVQAP